MILQIRSAILNILLDIRYFCYKKASKKVDFEEVTSFYIRWIYFVKVVIFVWANSSNPRQNTILHKWFFCVRSSLKKKRIFKQIYWSHLTNLYYVTINGKAMINIFEKNFKEEQNRLYKLLSCFYFLRGIQKKTTCTLLV